MRFPYQLSLSIVALVLFTTPANAHKINKTQELALKAMIESNAIVMFTGQCPSPWRQVGILDGRIPLGVNPLLPNGRTENGLSVRVVGDVGGEENHQLTVREMPSHNHSGVVSHGGFYPQHHKNGGDRRVPMENPGQIGHAGANAAHNNMPPFAVVSFCEIR